MRILGLFSGRRSEISEILCKQALLGAQSVGSEVEAVNLRSLELKPCTNCNACTDLVFGGSGDCVIKDDLPWLDERIMECDGIVVVMPVFEKSPPGDFKILMDRTGPSHDVELRREAMKFREKNGITDEQKKGPDPRSFKVRPASFIAHGGTDWSSMGLPVMESWAVPMGFTVASKMLFEWNVDLVLDSERLRQAFEIGKHTAESVAVEPEDRVYMGDDGVCPICHNNVMVMDGTHLKCAVCGVRGELSVIDGEIKVTFHEKAFLDSHLTEWGRKKHSTDLMNNARIMREIGFDVLKEKKKELCAVLPVMRKEASGDGK